MVQELPDYPLTALRDGLHGKVALIAPAGVLDVDVVSELQTRLARAGIDAHLAAHALEGHRYMAGSVEARLEDLYAAYALPDLAAVWCLRGGYGCAQLLPHIDWRRIHAAPLIGYSDITALLNAFYRRGLRAIHAPVASELARDLDARDQQAQRHDALNSIGRVLTATSGVSLPLRHVSGHQRSVTGPMVGGNLTTLASLAGTSHALEPPHNALVLLEDVGESYYRLERAFWQLLNSVDTRRIGAVCLGTFTHCPRREVPHSLETIFSEWLTPLGIPLYAGLPFGHGPENHAWPYGQYATLKADTLSW